MKNGDSIKMFISIIIPTYNRANSIKYTLDSFLNQNYPEEKYEIIVCDNKSTDNVKEVIFEYIKQYGEKRIKYIFESRQGVHYARNSAAKIAKGELLYFTDDDMIADFNLLKNLVPIFKDNNKVGCATGRILPRWETKPPKWIENYCKNSLLSLNDLGKITKVSRYDIGVYSCHEAIRKTAFWETGGFHPEYTKDVYLGDGETGLNQDIIKNGWLMAYVGTSKIYHMIPEKRMTQKHINKVSSNNGNAMSYNEYREKEFCKKDLKVRYWKYIISYFKECIIIIKKTLSGKSTLRFVAARLCYYKSRIIYDYQIVNNDKFRKLVKKNNWLN